MSEVEIEREIERTYAFCIHGILKDPRWVPTDYGAIEKSAAILAEEMLPLDRIFTAIEEVIAETGIKDASVDKIAAKIGLSKSSLYFYFKNRDEMLGRMIEREQAHVSALLKSRMQGIEGFPAKSFCYMVVTASYSLNNPALLTVFNWLRFQNIDVAVKPPDVAFMLDYFSFISEAYDQDILIGNKSDMLQAASFLHILSFRIVMDLRTLGVGYEAIMERLRNFHNLYLYGFLADKLTDEECL
jgi:AcrR family transcriptional regulator